MLVLRGVTERTEAIDAGWASLVGTDDARIVAAAKELLAGSRELPASGNPFGDGHAATRSAQAIAWMPGVDVRPEQFGAGYRR